MRMLKTFFRDVTTQSKTACAGGGKKNEREEIKSVRDLWINVQESDHWRALMDVYLEFGESLDGFKRTQHSQNSEGLYCLDVSSFVVSVDIETRY